MKTLAVTFLAVAFLLGSYPSSAQTRSNEPSADSAALRSKLFQYEQLLVKIINAYRLTNLRKSELNKFVDLCGYFWSNPAPELSDEDHYPLKATALYRLCYSANEDDNIVEAVLKLVDLIPSNDAEGGEMGLDFTRIVAQKNPGAFVRAWSKRDFATRTRLAYALRESLPQSYDAVELFKQFAASPEGQSVSKSAIQLALLIEEQRGD